jgi:hypothetical protein
LIAKHLHKRNPAKARLFNSTLIEKWAKFVFLAYSMIQIEDARPALRVLDPKIEWDIFAEVLVEKCPNFGDL